MRTLILGGLLATTITLAGAVSSAPPAAARSLPYAALRLPRPTGSHPVGAATLSLADRSRTDPWVPASGARRLMVSLRYPARAAAGRHAPYMTPQESALLLEGQRVTDVPPDVLSGTRTDAFAAAPPLRGRHPLVVLSPGFSLPRSSLTSLAEDLASRGYVVAVIDHTYETFGTTFPDGHTTTCVACEQRQTPELARKVVGGRVADVSFVLDRLLGSRTWNGLIDPSRIGMAGHSIGGDGTAAAMGADARIRAGINMDGAINTPISGLSRPFLLMGTVAAHAPDSTVDPSWNKEWPHLTGWRRWVTVAGTQHSSFTDLHPLADQLGLDFGTDISGVRAVQITRAYVGAFFDLHLRHRPASLLDGPSGGYPEVGFWN
ncbi:alpha/beta hydrolase [Actinoallomurus bryophytorum]|uniref:Platelet-activating factor acetylhydrolase isoform II n=1 Tax=Actinoallomurus bryophytorum TaxID=1490222 RepID=A0A543CJP3_9ACTN|nr:alpha/beta hydrolase [Actinoallomurus bryophytorum]TQL97260.1 platelet-activating factor acetylhydrolase isoform II [Actinoallomurus bryophytorum]